MPPQAAADSHGRLRSGPGWRCWHGSAFHSTAVDLPAVQVALSAARRSARRPPTANRLRMRCTCRLLEERLPAGGSCRIRPFLCPGPPFRRSHDSAAGGAAQTLPPQEHPAGYHLRPHPRLTVTWN